MESPPSLDIIITSYNRPEKVVELAKKLFQDSDLSAIVVDSGGNTFSKFEFMRVIKSSHKNQPYQRYLGAIASKADWLLYLDDDMEPIEGWYDKLLCLISDHPEKGLIGLKFEDKHNNSFIKNTPISITKSFGSNGIVKLFRSFSGYPVLKEGKYFKNGVKGPLPLHSGATEHTSGGAFIAKREFLYQNFNMQLFDLYEKRLGKGEDGILSYTVSKIAPVYYFAEQLFWHNDQGNSVYTQNHYQFNKVVAYSRAYLNYEYHRLNKLNPYCAWLSYLNFGFWRSVGLLINSLVNPTENRQLGFFGFVNGWLRGIYFKYEFRESKSQEWYNYALGDIANSEFR